MIDVLTYCEDTEALIDEIWNVFPERMSEDDNFLVDKIPTVRLGSNTLSLIRCNSGELEDLKSLVSLRVLGTYEEVFADPELKAIYDSVYIREYTYLDEDGNTVEGLKPEKIGVFA